jgi:hypothetical protein
MRRLAFLALLLAASCQRQAPAPLPQKQSAPVPPAAPPAAPPQPKTQPGPDDTAGAADLLRHYYALIEAGKYAEAWRMRSNGRGIDESQFADHFRAYESYRSQVGTPSEPVAAQGWIWVEVPVMTTGRFLGGKPFDSAGSVTLRRPAPNTASAERGWRIYTG